MMFLGDKVNCHVNIIVRKVQEVKSESEKISRKAGNLIVVKTESLAETELMASDDGMGFGDNIARARMRRWRTQGEFALAIGRSNSAVSRWEGGVNEPKLEDWLAIAELTGATLDELMRGTTPSPAVPVLSESEQIVVDLARELGLKDSMLLLSDAVNSRRANRSDGTVSPSRDPVTGDPVTRHDDGRRDAM